MATTTFIPSMLRGAGTRGVPLIPAGSSFTNDFSMNFDGIDDYINFSSAISLPGAFTLSAWIKPVSVTGNTCLIISSRTNNSNKIGTLGSNGLQIKLGGSIVYLTESGGNTFDLDVWQHLLITRDSSNNITAFRNGTSFGGSATNSNTGTYDSMGQFKNSNFLNSKLDEVAIFDSVQNVATLYNSGIPGDLSSLSPLHWYRFEEGSGTTAIDSGTGGSNGIINGATYSTDVPS
tara:strand:- start:104 stop:802 length:699 start_codon:yes stop_codon:yes gene_type:complete